MKRISRKKLRSLERELEELEQQARDLSSSDSPDEITLNWIESRTQQIKNLLTYEAKKALFSERGLSLAQ